MAKKTEELEGLLNQLFIDKNKLDKKMQLVTLSTINPSSRDSVYSSLLDNLLSVLSTTHQCLDHLNNNIGTLDRRVMNMAKNFIDGIMSEFNESIDRLQMISTDPDQFLGDLQQIYQDLQELNQKFLAIDNKIELRIFTDDENRLLKILKSQLAYLEKLFNDPQNFSPANIQKTLKKAESMAKVLNNPMMIINSILSDANNPNRQYLYDIYYYINENNKHLINHLKSLEAQHKQPSKTAPQSTETLLEKSTIAHENMLRALEQNAAKLKSMIDSAKGYQTIIDSSKETERSLAAQIERQINRIRADISKDLQSVTEGMNEILDRSLKEFGSTDLSIIKESLEKIKQSIQVMIGRNSDFLINNQHMQKLAQTEVPNIIAMSFRSLYSDLEAKVRKLDFKIKDAEKDNQTLMDLEFSAIDTLSWAQNDLNDISVKKLATTDPKEHFAIIDDNIEKLIDAQVSLLQYKSAFLATPGGKDRFDKLSHQIDAAVFKLIDTITNPKVKKQYDTQYHSIIERRVTTNQALPSWASIKPDVASKDMSKITPPSSDSEKTP